MEGYGSIGFWVTVGINAVILVLVVSMMVMVFLLGRWYKCDTSSNNKSNRSGRYENVGDERGNLKEGGCVLYLLLY